MTKPTTYQPPTIKKRDQFTISVFPQVKKFMLKNFPHQNGVFKSEEWTTFGSLVTLCLIDTRSWKDHSLHDTQLKQLTGKVTIALNAQQLRLSPRLGKLMRINSEISRLFKEHLITWIRSQYEMGVPTYTACKSFLEFYNIDPDGNEFNVDSAYKAWQRRTRTVKKNGKRSLSISKGLD